MGKVCISRLRFRTFWNRLRKIGSISVIWSWQVFSRVDIGHSRNYLETRHFLSSPLTSGKIGSTTIIRSWPKSFKIIVRRDRRRSESEPFGIRVSSNLLWFLSTPALDYSDSGWFYLHRNQNRTDNSRIQFGAVCVILKTIMIYLKK